MASETMPELASVANAHRDFKAAGEALLAAMEAALPVGTYVEIPRGNGTIRGWVIGHGSSWACQTLVRVEVESTGNAVNCYVGHLIPSPAPAEEADRGE